MVRGLCGMRGRREDSARGGQTVPAAANRRRDLSRRSISMQWQTPAAADFRFGFEITLYVAAR